MVSWLVDISPASRCANIETMARNARITIAAVIGRLDTWGRGERSFSGNLLIKTALVHLMDDTL